MLYFVSKKDKKSRLKAILFFLKIGPYGFTKPELHADFGPEEFFQKIAPEKVRKKLVKNFF